MKIYHIDAFERRETPLPDYLHGFESRIGSFTFAPGSEEGARLDSAARIACLARNGIRSDSVTATIPGWSMSLTSRRRQILEEDLPKNNAFAMFRTYNEIPLGAREFTVPYAKSIGEAVLYRGGTAFPTVHRVGQEDSFKTAIIVSSYEVTTFGQQEAAYIASQGMMALNTEAGLSKTVIEAINAKANHLYWFGDVDAGLYGILTYPSLLKKTSDVAFDGTESPTDVAAALNDAIRYPAVRSKSTYRANRVTMSERLHGYLSTTRIGTNSDITVLKFVEQCNPGVLFDVAWECYEPRASGYDYILIRNDGVDHSCIGIQQGIVFYPPEQIGFTTRNLVTMQVGGAGMMFKPGANMLLEVKAA